LKQVSTEFAELKLENTRLRTGLHDAVGKIEKYKADVDELKRKNEELRCQIEKITAEAADCQKKKVKYLI